MVVKSTNKSDSCLSANLVMGNSDDNAIGVSGRKWEETENVAVFQRNNSLTIIVLIYPISS